uniref:CBF1-interacting co-repressor CIR N-terminal domain-containing protein n=1 Tax=Glossina morsitans morsitans TaxID=37546 RepID=A0A1B0GF40_GLOMM
MNILPKKRWHVRTKDNIARVRKDEAAAKAEDLKRQQQVDFAESEARLNFLRKRSGLPEKHTDYEKRTKNTQDIPSCSNASEDTQQHIDLFADYKSHVKTTNKDFEKEKKEEQEKYEKQIGYLTYLGQDTNEALKLKSWYEVVPKRNIYDRGSETAEKDIKNKHKQDPLTLINALLPSEKKTLATTTSTKSGKSNVISTEQQEKSYDDKKEKTHKKHKKTHRKAKKLKHKKRSKHSKHKKEKVKDENEILNEKRLKLELLRKERLQREAKERERQEALFGPKEVSITEPATVPRIKQKYNSQFNPEIAKQNMN